MLLESLEMLTKVHKLHCLGEKRIEGSSRIDETSVDVTTESIIVMGGSIDLQNWCQSLLERSRNSGMMGVFLILATTQECSLAIEELQSSRSSLRAVTTTKACCARSLLMATRAEISAAYPKA